MEFRQIVKVLIRWWWLVALPIVIVSGYIALTYHPPAVTYQAVVRFAAGGEPAAISIDYDRYYHWLSSEYIANGLADIAETGAFAQAVTARLAQHDIEVAPATVQGSIVSDNAQSIVVLTITWPDPEQLVNLAEAISVEITENAPTYFPQATDIGTVARRLDDPKPVPLSPSLRSQLVGPGLRLILAACVGLALAFLAHYLDPSIHERTELEALEIPVLMVLPRRHLR